MDFYLLSLLYINVYSSCKVYVVSIFLSNIYISSSTISDVLDIFSMQYPTVNGLTFDLEFVSQFLLIEVFSFSCLYQVRSRHASTYLSILV